MADDVGKSREDLIFDALWAEMERQSQSETMDSPYVYADDEGKGVSGIDGHLDLRAMARAVNAALSDAAAK